MDTDFSALAESDDFQNFAFFVAILALLVAWSGGVRSLMG